MEFLLPDGDARTVESLNNHFPVYKAEPLQ